MVVLWPIHLLEEQPRVFQPSRIGAAQDMSFE
jgi:hypothetical protein